MPTCALLPSHLGSPSSEDAPLLLLSPLGSTANLIPRIMNLKGCLTSLPHCPPSPFPPSPHSSTRPTPPSPAEPLPTLALFIWWQPATPVLSCCGTEWSPRGCLSHTFPSVVYFLKKLVDVKGMCPSAPWAPPFIRKCLLMPPWISLYAFWKPWLRWDMGSRAALALRPWDSH